MEDGGLIVVVRSPIELLRNPLRELPRRRSANPGGLAAAGDADLHPRGCGGVWGFWRASWAFG